MRLTGERDGFRGGDPDDMLLLARELDRAADEVARSSHAVRLAAASVCRDLGCVQPRLTSIVVALRQRADSLRERAAALAGTCVADRAGSVTFTVPAPRERVSFGHVALDAAGLVPFLGAVPDVANAAWYAAEGDTRNALLSAAAALPAVGEGLGAARFVAHADDVGAAVRIGARLLSIADLYATDDAGDVLDGGNVTLVEDDGDITVLRRDEDGEVVVTSWREQW